MLTLGDSSVLGSLASRFESRRQFAYAEPLRRAVARRDSGIASLSALRANLRYQGKWAAADSVQNEAARRYPTNALIGRWAMLRAMLAGDLEGRRRVIDSISGAGDKLDPVQAVNRAMELAQSEGRLRDADSLRNESFRAYSARGIDVGAYSRPFLALDDVANENLPYKTALKSFDDAYANAPPSLKLGSPVALVRTFGKLGLAARARATLAEYERVVTDASVRASNAPEMEDAMVYVAMAERRWTDAAAALRRADRLPDGPANGCEECLPRNLVHLFAAAGMADSALAQYELYRRTPMGSRPRTGPDLQLEPNSVLAVARMYDERGDTVRAVAMYRDYTKRFERADPELQPRVQAAQRRLVELTPVERTRR